MSSSDPLKSKRLPRFVEEYVRDPNATRAALAAGWPRSWAHTAGWELLQKPEVQKMIEDGRAAVAEAAKIEAVEVLRQWIELATADPSKLSHVRRCNCRYCWGVGHEYQWAAREYAKACDKAATNRNPKTGTVEPLPMPDCSGGFGWVFNAEPNANCPECHGEGVESLFVADVQSLSGPERRLFAGIKMTAAGPEVKLRDQDAALANIAKHLGMLVEKRELTGKDGKPLMPAPLPAQLPTDPGALAALYQQYMGG